MDAFQEGGYTLRDLVQVVLRNRLKVCLFLVTVMLLTGVFLLMTSRSYESEARLLVRGSAEGLAGDSASNGSQSHSVGEEELNTVVELLGSRTILEQVVAQVGAARILGQDDGEDYIASDAASNASASEPMATAGSDLSQERIGEALRDGSEKLGAWLNPADLTEKAVDRLEKELDVFAPEKSSIIVISAEGHSPEVAQLVVNSVVDVYRGFHAELHSTSESVEFLSIQADELHSQLGDTRQRIRDFKTEIGVVSIASRQESLQEHINTVSNDLLKTKADLASARGRMTGLARGADLFPERIKTSETTGAALTNVAAETMRSQLYGLEIEAAALRAKYTAVHPEVRAIEKQITDLRAVLAQEQGDEDSVVISTDVNPKYQEWLLDTLKEDASEKALVEQLKVLQDQQVELAAEVGQLNLHEVRMTELQDQEATLSERYLATLASLEQARLAQRLKEHEISDVVVVQNATLQRRPVSPNIPMILAIASVIAVCGSLALAMLCDLFDGSLRSEADLERTLKVPILATIPRVAHRQSIIKYERSIRGAKRSGNNRSQATDSSPERGAEAISARG